MFILGLSSCPKKDWSSNQVLRYFLQATGAPHQHINMEGLEAGNCEGCYICGDAEEKQISFDEIVERVETATALVVSLPTDYVPGGKRTPFWEHLFGKAAHPGLKHKAVVVLALGGQDPKRGAEDLHRFFQAHEAEVFGVIKSQGVEDCSDNCRAKGCFVKGVIRQYGATSSITTDVLMGLDYSKPDIPKDCPVKTDVFPDIDRLAKQLAGDLGITRPYP